MSVNPLTSFKGSQDLSILSLPSDILTYIFSYVISDLGNLSRVCKRFYAVTKKFDDSLARIFSNRVQIQIHEYSRACSVKDNFIYFPRPSNTFQRLNLKTGENNPLYSGYVSGTIINQEYDALIIETGYLKFKMICPQEVLEFSEVKFNPHTGHHVELTPGSLALKSKTRTIRKWDDTLFDRVNMRDVRILHEDEHFLVINIYMNFTSKTRFLSISDGSIFEMTRFEEVSLSSMGYVCSEVSRDFTSSTQIRDKSNPKLVLRTLTPKAAIPFTDRSWQLLIGQREIKVANLNDNTAKSCKKVKRIQTQMQHDCFPVYDYFSGAIHYPLAARIHNNHLDVWNTATGKRLFSHDYPETRVRIIHLDTEKMVVANESKIYVYSSFAINISEELKYRSLWERFFLLLNRIWQAVKVFFTNIHNSFPIL